MTEQQTLEQLGEIIKDIAEVPPGEIRSNQRFVEDLGIDSLTMVEIAVAAQDRFEVELADDDLKDLKTIQDVIDYIRRADIAA
jgi:acyl carrier protein